MALSTCLFCDRLSIVNVYSTKNQMVHLCATHWFVYIGEVDNPVRAEILKYFKDGDPSAELVKTDEILRRNGFPIATDDSPGNYETKPRN